MNLKNQKFKLINPSNLFTGQFIILHDNLVRFYHILELDQYRYYIIYHYNDNIHKYIIHKNNPLKLLINA